ncbi:DUF6223 family protein [Spirillospora sp. NPDC048824]|uniref:DUF6223 family protein n=1 Tax=Spirillospora sp. NPDC048824 TaxID=3364526 RepID=UPI003722C2EE
MSVHHLLAAADAYSMSAGRLGSTAAALTGLIGVVAGGLALARGRRNGAVVALVAGLVGMTVGVLVAATADGGVGTGNGLGGAVVAVVVGLVGAALGGLALVRARRIG